MQASGCMCVCVFERVCVCMCMCVYVRKREYGKHAKSGVTSDLMSLCVDSTEINVCVCVCMCVCTHACYADKGFFSFSFVPSISN